MGKDDRPDSVKASALERQIWGTSTSPPRKPGKNRVKGLTSGELLPTSQKLPISDQQSAPSETGAPPPSLEKDQFDDAFRSQIAVNSSKLESIMREIDQIRSDLKESRAEQKSLLPRWVFTLVIGIILTLGLLIFGGYFLYIQSSFEDLEHPNDKIPKQETQLPSQTSPNSTAPAPTTSQPSNP